MYIYIYQITTLNTFFPHFPPTSGPYKGCPKSHKPLCLKHTWLSCFMWHLHLLFMKEVLITSEFSVQELLTWFTNMTLGKQPSHWTLPKLSQKDIVWFVVKYMINKNLKKRFVEILYKWYINDWWALNRWGAKDEAALCFGLGRIFLSHLHWLSAWPFRSLVQMQFHWTGSCDLYHKK
jgi:hypothetical protein